MRKKLPVTEPPAQTPGDRANNPSSDVCGAAAAPAAPLTAIAPTSPAATAAAPNLPPNVMRIVWVDPSAIPSDDRPLLGRIRVADVSGFGQRDAKCANT